MIPKIKQFYEKYPFPNYNFIGLKNKEDLYKIKNYIFNLIDKKDLVGKEILEVGCGTGALTAKLALYGKVIGIDISEKSLDMARNLLKKFNLNGDFFYDDIINTKINKKFDIVISLGVLHHTENPEKAFENICRLTREGGLIIVSLYAKYNYIIDKINEKLLTKRIDKDSIIHFMDGYRNPKRSTHPIDEILRWFKKNNIKFVNAFPPIDLKSYFKLFKRMGFKFIKKSDMLNPDFDVSSLKLISKKGNKLSHFLIELAWLFSLYDATIIMVGRKKKKK